MSIISIMYWRLHVLGFQLQHEAKLSLEHLDNRFLDGFELLFMRPVSFQHKFDQYCV